MNQIKKIGLLAVMLLGTSLSVFASEANLAIPDLRDGTFHFWGSEVSSWNFLFYGALIILGTLFFSLLLRSQIKGLPVHKSMKKVSETIYTTCRTYLTQQGRFL